MRYFIALLMLALSSGVSSAQAQQVDSKPLAITHVTVIDVTAAAPQPDMTVIINGNRITALGKANNVRIPQGAQVIDATGKFLIPGLWDMHIHLTVIPDQEITRNLIAPLLVAAGLAGPAFLPAEYLLAGMGRLRLPVVASVVGALVKVGLVILGS